MRWTLIFDSSGRPGSENMSLDNSLLRLAQGGVGFLRLYRWDPPCLSFGRNEPALTRYDRSKIESLGLSTVRRPTGGRAVWHDAEVTYAVAAPATTFGSLRETYNIVHATLAAALRQLGVEATLATRPSGRTASLNGGACFAAPVGGEVVTPAGKLVGSAQVREGAAFLQHGAVLLDGRQDLVAAVTRGVHLPLNATSLSAELGREATFAEVSEAIAARAAADWEGEWKDGDADPSDQDVAQFADPAWTWRR
jgi:lipoate-protein ligase A